MLVLLAHDRHWKEFYRSSHDVVPTFFSSHNDIKNSSTLPVWERRREKSLHLITLYIPLKQENAWKKERQAFRCWLNKAMEMWDESSIWRFSNSGTWVTHFFCCWRSEKLFPVISHLVTSSTNILLLLVPAVVIIFYSRPQTDGSRALITAPHTPVLKFSISVCYLYKIVAHPCCSLSPANSIGKFVKEIHWRVNSHFLWYMADTNPISVNASISFLEIFTSLPLLYAVLGIDWPSTFLWVTSVAL